MGEIKLNELPQGETKAVRITVEVTGIKKRARTIARHSLEVGTFTPDYNPEYVKALSKSVLKANIREVTQGVPHIRVTNQVFEVEGGMVIRRFSSDDIFNAVKIPLEG